MFIVFVTGQLSLLSDQLKQKLRNYGRYDEKGSCPYLTREDGTHSYWVFVNNDVIVYPPQDCSQGTKWDLDYCTCVPSQQPLDFVDPRLLSSIVAPTAPAACNVLANISYNSLSGSFESATYVQMGDYTGKAKLNEIRVQGPTGSSSSFVLVIAGTPLVLQSFNGNQLLGPWQSKLRFQPTKDFRGSAILLSDDCKDNVDQVQQDAKSMEIVFTGNAVNVYFRFKDNVTSQSCNVRPDSNGWYLVELTSVSTDINVAVNGNPCVRVDTGAALWMKCGLRLGGSLGASTASATSQTTFYLDYFRFYKNPQSCS